MLLLKLIFSTTLLCALTAVAAVGPNSSLGGDPEALPPEHRAQAEPHIARSFLDPDLILATFQEGRFTDGGAVTCGYSVSTNGGAAWSRKLIPSLVRSLDGGRFHRATDPVAAIGPDGTFYLNTLGITFTNVSEILGALVLSVSTNFGEAFDPPLLVFDSGDPDVFPDKNWMAVNPFPSSPTAGRIAVVFTLFTPNNWPIQITLSDDRGRSWTTPRSIASGQMQGAQCAFFPDGSLLIVYSNYRLRRLEAAFSPDGGGTFLPPQVVAPYFPHDDPVARDGWFLSSLAVDLLSGSAFVAFQESVDGPRIRVTRSLDHGQSWTSPVSVNDTPASASVFNPAIAASPDGQHLTVLYQDKRHDTARRGFIVDAYLAESFDGGLTWQPNTRVSEISSDLSLAPLTSSGYMFGDYHGIVPSLDLDTPGWAVWIDSRSGSPDPFVAPIHRTAPATFAAWQQLHFPGPTEPELAAPYADPDADQLSNAAEYVFATRPLVPNLFPPIDVSVRNGAFVAAIETLAVAEDVEFHWFTSTDLVAWTPQVPSQILSARAPWAFLHRLEFEFPAEAQARFFKLNPQLNPNQ